jgi:DNA-binding NtrC family response regulator
MKRVRSLIRRFAEMDANVLVVGESGTGKALAARLLHDLGPRRDGPFVRIHCAGLAFGESSMAEAKPATIQVPEGGTLFLEEIGDLPEAGQAALLPLLADREDSPHSGRIVCSSARLLGEQVAAGRFREDLHYRLNELTIAIPPLRERREDIPILAEWILKDAAFRAGQPVKALSDEVAALFERHHWPGNGRQLRNILEYAAVICAKATIQTEHLPVGFPASDREEPGSGTPKPEEVGRLEILEALRVTRWHKTKAAELLGISRSTFYRKMGELGIG